MRSSSFIQTRGINKSYGDSNIHRDFRLPRELRVIVRQEAGGMFRKTWDAVVLLRL